MANKVDSQAELFKSIFAFVFNAARRRKVYCIGRGFTCAKRYLQQRGWINVGRGVANSKYAIKKTEAKTIVLHNLTMLRENAKVILRNMDPANNGGGSGNHHHYDKRTLFLLLIADFVPNYIWITHRTDVRWNYLKPDQSVNRFPRVVFTTKNGLNRILYDEDNCLAAARDRFYPRCYELSDPTELEKFVGDYKFTACSALLRWFYGRCLESKVLFSDRPGDCVAEDDALPVTLAVMFSLEFCSLKLGLEKTFSSASKSEDDEDRCAHLNWQAFLQCFYVTVKKEYAEISKASICGLLRSQSKSILEEITNRMPQNSIDGTRNVWIIKPGNASRGRGITLRQSIKSNCCYSDLFPRWERGIWGCSPPLEALAQLPMWR